MKEINFPRSPGVRECNDVLILLMYITKLEKGVTTSRSAEWWMETGGFVDKTRPGRKAVMSCLCADVSDLQELLFVWISISLLTAINIRLEKWMQEQLL